MVNVVAEVLVLASALPMLPCLLQQLQQEYVESGPVRMCSVTMLPATAHTC
jgi:hypothetical protein